MKKLFLALFVSLSFYASSAFALCINPSIISVVFGSYCPPEYFEPDPADNFNWAAYVEIKFGFDEGAGHGPVICDPLTLVQIDEFTCGALNLTDAQLPWSFYTEPSRAPEPSLASLLGLGALALIVTRRKRRTGA